MFLGKNICWALLEAHFNPCLAAFGKMSLCQVQNKFMLVSIYSFALLL